MKWSVLSEKDRSVKWTVLLEKDRSVKWTVLSEKDRSVKWTVLLEKDRSVSRRGHGRQEIPSPTLLPCHYCACIRRAGSPAARWSHSLAAALWDRAVERKFCEKDGPVREGHVCEKDSPVKKKVL